MSPNSIRQTQWAVESLGASARVYLPEGFRLATVEGSAAAAPASLATLRVWHFKQYQPKLGGGGGLRSHDLCVMSATSYRTALPRYTFSNLKDLCWGAPLSNVDAPVCICDDSAEPPEEHTRDGKHFFRPKPESCCTPTITADFFETQEKFMD